MADSALLNELVAMDELRDAIERQARWHGVTNARRVLELASPLSESPLESLSRLFMADNGVPLPEQQRWVETHRGWYRVDGLWRTRTRHSRGRRAEQVPHRGRPAPPRSSVRRRSNERVTRSSGSCGAICSSSPLRPWPGSGTPCAEHAVPRDPNRAVRTVRGNCRSVAQVAGVGLGHGDEARDALVHRRVGREQRLRRRTGWRSSSTTSVPAAASCSSGRAAVPASSLRSAEARASGSLDSSAPDSSAWYSRERLIASCISRRRSGRGSASAARRTGCGRGRCRRRRTSRSSPGT